MAEITQELKDTIRNLANGKAYGYLPAQSETPNAWRECRIYTIHKGGDVSKCSNSRPISLQSSTYKAFMSAMTKRLTRYVEKEELISNAQGGCRKDRTCLEKVEILNQLRIPAVTFGLEVIRPTIGRIASWDRIVRSLINKKVGIHWNSTMELHYLPPSKLGLGLTCLEEYIQRAKVRGIVHRGLCSFDKDTSHALANKLKLNQIGSHAVVISEPIILYVKPNLAHHIDRNNFLDIFKEYAPEIYTLNKYGITDTDKLIDDNGEVHVRWRNKAEDLTRVQGADARLPLVIR